MDAATRLTARFEIYDSHIEDLAYRYRTTKYDGLFIFTGYSGWQIIDPTPQEESEAVYHCGPASVEAVRRGEVGFQYDTPFMYCQLNAELCHFQEEENSEWGFIRMASNQYQ